MFDEEEYDDWDEEVEKILDDGTSLHTKEHQENSQVQAPLSVPVGVYVSRLSAEMLTERQLAQSSL